MRMRVGSVIIVVVLAILRAGYRAHHPSWFSHTPKSASTKTVNPEDYLVNRGLDALNAQDYDKALECFDRAISLSPSSAANYFNRGITYQNKKEYDHAIADFTEGLKLAPGSVEGYWDRGRTFSYKKDYDSALKDFSEAIRIEPKNFKCYLERGSCYSESNDTPAALADLNKAVSLAPTDPEAFLARGAVQEKLKKYDQALEDYTEAIRLAPQSAEAYNSRGMVYDSKKDYGHALADYSKAIAVDDTNVHAYNNLAWFWCTCPRAELRNGKMAVEYARYVCELTKWKETFYFDTLAAAYAEVGDFDEAIRWQKKGVAAADTYEDKKEAEKGEARLKLFEAHKPYRGE